MNSELEQSKADETQTSIGAATSKHKVQPSATQKGLRQKRKTGVNFETKKKGREKVT
jgi:hypothetical protein